MIARDIDEPHRAATPLELLFDLCFVVAVAQASGRMHHALSEGRVGPGWLSYAMVFFAIWWAWMNFTWFGSAYDTDDVPYRLTAFVQIAGALIFAAGIPRAFDQHDFTVATVGYAVMRSGLVANWIRVARSYPAGRRTAVRFAVGVALCELGWLGLLTLPQHTRIWGWLVLVPAELAVPVWAEHVRRTSWHPAHIAERFGLFTIIVLGESVLAAAVTVQSAVDAGEGIGSLYVVAGGGLLTVFAMWWLYFAKPAHRFLTSNRVGFTWGYGHYLVFASAAAVGAGLAVAADHATHHSALPATPAAAALTVPVAIFLVTVWALQIRPHHAGLAHSVLTPAAAVLVLAATFTGHPVLGTGLILTTWSRSASP